LWNKEKCDIVFQMTFAPEEGSCEYTKEDCFHVCYFEI
jgi:hypothetical protein